MLFNRTTSSASKDVHAHRGAGVNRSIDEASRLVPNDCTDQLFDRVPGPCKSAQRFAAHIGLDIENDASLVAVDAREVASVGATRPLQ